MKKKIKNKHEEGFVLVVSLLILAVSVAIGGGTVYNATKQVVQSKNKQRNLLYDFAISNPLSYKHTLGPIYNGGLLSWL